MAHVETQATAFKKAPISIIKDYLPILIIWNILFIAETIFHLSCSNGFIPQKNVEKMLLFSQIFKSGTILLFGLLLVGGTLVSFGKVIRKKLSSIILPLLIWPMVMLYFASWYGYKLYGQFYTIDVFQPLYHDPLQIFQHLFQTMSLWSIALPLGLLLVLFFMRQPVKSLKNKFPDKAVKPYLVTNLLLCLFFLIITVVFEHKFEQNNTLVTDPALGVTRSIKEIYHEHVEMQSDPLVTLLYGIYYNFHPPEIAIQNTKEFPIERRKITSLSEYIQHIDQQSVKHYNIILLLVESLRMDQLMDFKGNVCVMPNLEKLSQQSIRFTDNYTQASHSNYADLCPLSSHYPLRSREMYYYPENAPYPKVLIYDILKKIGYKTAIISSQNENWGNMYNYLNTGNLDLFFHSETYGGTTYIPDADMCFAAFAKKTKMSGKIDDSNTVAQAIQWIDSVGSSPFFIYMNLQNSHIPYPIPDDFPRKFSPNHIDFQLRFNDFPRDKIDIVKGMYSDSLRYVDFQFGKVVKHLEEKKLIQNTIIVVTGDTGQAFYEHGFANHAGPIFDEVMRVPLFFLVPGMQPQSSSRPSQHIDIPPTLLSLLNLPRHPSFQGIDLMSPNEFRDRSRFILAQTPFSYQCGVIKNDFKLIFSPRHQTVRLFNLKIDPDEKTNIANAQPAVMKQMFNLTYAWMANQLSYYEKTSLYTYTYPPYYSF